MKYKKVDKISRVTGESIGVRWTFTRYNPKSKVTERIAAESIPLQIRNTQNEQDVIAYCNSQSAIEDAAVYRAKMRSQWRKTYHNYETLLEKFTDYQKERAPNSYKNDVYYLETYAFHYFLDKKENATYWQWSLHYNDFRAWLRTAKPSRWERKCLGLNTQNNIIKALNVFLGMVASENGKPILKCPQYKRSELNQVTALDLIEDHEIKKLQEALLEISKDSHDLFTLIAATGLRENEALGMCVGFIFEGNIKGKKLDKLHKQLEVYGLDDYFGYICLESQPALPSYRAKQTYKDRFGATWATGTVPRKPLKCRKKIEPQNHRFIPIFEKHKECWNIIVDRWNHQHDLMAKKTFGANPRDYLLFDGLTSSMFYNDLREAYEKTKLRFRSIHKLRHTWLTWFYDKTDESRFLAKKVCGHNEERSVLVYSHINEQVGREQALKTQSKTKLKRIS